MHINLRNIHDEIRRILDCIIPRHGQCHKKCPSRLALHHIRHRLLIQLILGGNANDKGSVLNEADGSMLQLTGCISLRMNIRNLLHLQRALKPNGKIIVNTQQINPMPVIIGAAEYPENLVEKMKAAGIDVDAFDALTLAGEAGSAKAVNIVLMGHLSKNFDFSEEEWLQAIEASVPAKFLELNKKAFTLGRNA